MSQQAKLRHFAITRADPEATAQFYEQAFGMRPIGRTDLPITSGFYLSDGVINRAIFKYKDMAASGTPERGLEWYGIHHVGFWVDEVKSAGQQISGWVGAVKNVDEKEPAPAK